MTSSAKMRRVVAWLMLAAVTLPIGAGAVWVARRAPALPSGEVSTHLPSRPDRTDRTARYTLRSYADRPPPAARVADARTGRTDLRRPRRRDPHRREAAANDRRRRLPRLPASRRSRSAQTGGSPSGCRLATIDGSSNTRNGWIVLGTDHGARTFARFWNCGTGDRAGRTRRRSGNRSGSRSRASDTTRTRPTVRRRRVGSLARRAVEHLTRTVTRSTQTAPSAEYVTLPGADRSHVPAARSGQPRAARVRTGAEEGRRARSEGRVHPGSRPDRTERAPARHQSRRPRAAGAFAAEHAPRQPPRHDAAVQRPPGRGTRSVPRTRRAHRVPRQCRFGQQTHLLRAFAGRRRGAVRRGPPRFPHLRESASPTRPARPARARRGGTS